MTRGTKARLLKSWRRERDRNEHGKAHIARKVIDSIRKRRPAADALPVLDSVRPRR